MNLHYQQRAQTMSDQSTVEKQQRGEAADAAIKAAIASERRRCIDRVLTYAALRDQAAVNLDKAEDGGGPEKPSEGAAERVRMQAEVARDIAAFLAEETLANPSLRMEECGLSDEKKRIPERPFRKRKMVIRATVASRPARGRSNKLARLPMVRCRWRTGPFRPTASVSRPKWSFNGVLIVPERRPWLVQN